MRMVGTGGWQRFIPAGAGNTAQRNRWASSQAVHPRWRGEHHGLRQRIRRLIGSSPLARGTLQPPSEARNHDRFIPAGAGNTHGLSKTITEEAVHPRWRGEHR